MMTQRSFPLGSPERPLQVAIAGSGPAGFYTAGALLKQKDLHLNVDMFERTAMPYGLVRYGVAPDHQKTKQVIRAYEATARDPRFRFFGNVQVGRDLQVKELQQHYDQIVYAVGCESDRRLGIPGEDLPGSHTATAFVAWYNGHPDHRYDRFDLSARRVAVVGVGNVAMDVTRILVRNVEELPRPTSPSTLCKPFAGARWKRWWCWGAGDRSRPSSLPRKSARSAACPEWI